MAELATGKPYVYGDTYDIHGIPKNGQGTSVVDALSTLINHGVKLKKLN